MRAARLVGAALLSCGLWWTGLALAGGFRDPGEAWLLPGGEVVRLMHGDPPGDGATWSVVATEGHLFGMPELPQTGLDVRWSSKARTGLRLEVTWSDTGRDPYRSTGLRAALRLPGLAAPGVEWRQRRTELAGEGMPAWSRIYATWSLSGGWASGRGEIRVHLPLNHAPAGAVPEGREPFFEGRWRQGACAMVWRLERDATGRPRSGGSVDIALGGRVALGLRGDLPSGSLGPGLTVRRGPLLLRTSHLAHPRLGVTHRFAVGVVRP